MPVFLSRRGAALAAAVVAGLFARSASLSAQALPPSQTARPFTPAQALAATSALDAHVADHPKRKAAVAPAKPSTATAIEASRVRVLRTPVPALKASRKAKKGT